MSDPALDSALAGVEPVERQSSDPDDIHDLTAARVGDHAAFARIYDRHAAVVLSICRRYAGRGMHDLPEAEDALQETFIRAYRLLDTIDDPHRLRPWLFGIARRVCSERRRAGARRRHHEEVAMSRETSAASETRTAPGAAEDSAARESLRRLDVALEALPDEERLAIHLFYLDPDPIRAAQECLHLSRSGFYKLLARARGRLSRLMLEAPAP